MHRTPLTVLVSLTLASAFPAQLQWAQKDIPTARDGHAAANDTARERVVLFGGSDSSVLSDTWEWDGTRWIRRHPSTVPSPRDLHGMAFDAGRGVTVMFGGRGASNETWEWDGHDWTQRFPANAPPARHGHEMVYDAARGVVILFGGVTGIFANAETWQWDGVDWTQLSPANVPFARDHFGMVYDPVRSVVVMYGGSSNAGVGQLGDTWEWDGSDWTWVFPTAVPTGREGHAMTWNTNTGRTMLVGGMEGFGGTLLADVWEYDGATWTQVPATEAPAGRTDHVVFMSPSEPMMFGGTTELWVTAASDQWSWDGSSWNELTDGTSPRATDSTAVAFDEARGEVVQFGGWTVTTPYAEPMGSTWTWDGEAWTQRTPANAPTPRGRHTMAYDSDRQVVLMFGGDGTTGGLLTDTWTWDGATWTQQLPANSPPDRMHPAMAYDRSRGEMVMFGGTNHSDTWVWNGADWTERFPATVPPARMSHAMAYDESRDRVVMFGGWHNFPLGVGTDDTWEWDGTDWTQITPPVSPAARRAHSMVYDPVRGTVVLFGGQGNAFERRKDVWEWDGVQWTQLSPTGLSSGREGHAAAFDRARAQLVVFGGDTVELLAETWVLGNLTPADATELGTGCTGSNPTQISAFGKPFLGNDGFAMDVLDAASGAPGAMFFAASSATIPIGGCTFYLVPPIPSAPFATNASGFASVAFPIPDDPALEGAPFYGQALVVDATGPFAGIAFSAAAHMVIGQ